jgi:allantoate deiminase
LTTQRHLQVCSPSDLAALAQRAVHRCDQVASFTEEPSKITRTFLSEPMRELHELVTEWMRAAGMIVHCDAAGNLIGRYEGASSALPVLMIGSHLDTVPDAGKYDGVLGVLLGLAAVEALGGRRLPFGIDVIAFSEEEGIRYRAPFLGSRAICGQFDRDLLNRIDAKGVSMAQAFRAFALDPERIDEAAYPRGRIGGYLEVHIEQGPVLENRGVPVGVVTAISGQSRLWAQFRGKAGHAGTLPMQGRRDALAAAAELVLEVERLAHEVPELRATVGTLLVEPGAVNVVPGAARPCIDVRHANDEARMAAVAEIKACADLLATRRGVAFAIVEQEHHRAVPADSRLSDLLGAAVMASGQPLHQLESGAGHDAGVMAKVAPWGMLFVRSPGGVSHSPDECVLEGDVHVALDVVVKFLDILADADIIENDICSSTIPQGAS